MLGSGHFNWKFVICSVFRRDSTICLSLLSSLENIWSEESNLRFRNCFFRRDQYLPYSHFEHEIVFLQCNQFLINVCFNSAFAFAFICYNTNEEYKIDWHSWDGRHGVKREIKERGVNEERRRREEGERERENHQLNMFYWRIFEVNTQVQ